MRKTSYIHIYIYVACWHMRLFRVNGSVIALDTYVRTRVIESNGNRKIKLEATEWMYWYTSSSDSKSSGGEVISVRRSSVALTVHRFVKLSTHHCAFSFFFFSSFLSALRFSSFTFFLYRLRLPSTINFSFILFSFHFCFFFSFIFLFLL